MLWLRRFIFTFPLLVLAFFAVAFIMVKAGPTPHQNILTMGSIGEPENLNPIRATTVASSEVTSLIFNGLLTTDENNLPIPELATGWDLGQTSRMFFNSDADAEAVKAALEKVAVDVKLSKATREGKGLLLEFADAAGPEYQDRIPEAIKAHPPRPVWLVTITPGTNKAFADGAEVVPAEMAKRVRQAIDAGGVDAKIVETYTPLDQSLELLGHGPEEAIGKVVNELCQVDDPKKALAEVAYEIFAAQDKPVYVFRLRQGVRWHAGRLGGQDFGPEEFTAEDVKFTYESLVSPTVLSPRASDYLLIESCDVVDRYTVRVTYKKPYSVALDSWMMSLLPKHVLAGRDVKWWSENYDRAPLGTGPFKFDFWRKGEIIRLARNDDYFQGPPHVDAVYYRYITDQTNIKLALETGGIDFYSVDPFAVKRFKEDRRFDLYEFLQRGYSYVGWNLKRPLFQDRRVRVALAHAVNIDEIIKYLMYGHARQSLGIFGPQFWFANPNVKPLEYSPAKARQLLADAGWKDADGDGYLDKDGKRFEFELITNNANETRRDISVIVQDQLKAIGVKVNLKQYEWSVFIEQYINKGNFDACVLGWQVGTDYDMYQLWHSSQIAKPDTLNHCGYKNPNADALLERIRVTFDREKVRRMTWELQQLIYDDQPYLWLFVVEATAAVHRDTFRVCRPTPEGQWIEEPIRAVPSGLLTYLPYWYRVDHRPAVLAKAVPGPVTTQPGRPAATHEDHP